MSASQRAPKAWGEAQGQRYADLPGVPFIVLSIAEEVWFRDKRRDAHFRQVGTVFSQGDLPRRKAAVVEPLRGDFDILWQLGFDFTVLARVGGVTP